MHIEGREGEVILPDGRIVSRQRAWQIQNGDQYKAQRKAWLLSDSGRSSIARTNKRQADKHRDKGEVN